ncbi:DUF6069 family protein [Thermus sp.]
MAPLGLGLLATGMALGTNLLLYALARLAGAPFQVAPPGRAPEEVGLAAVALFTALPMALGFALYVPLRRRTPKAFPLFLGLALAVFVLMLFPPLAAASDPRTELGLIALHVPPVASYLWGLARMEEAL